MWRLYIVICTALALMATSCSKEEDNYVYPDEKYGVYVINATGGDLGRLLAKYDLSLYPYIGVEGNLQYEDFQMLKHIQKVLMYLNLEKVSIEGYETENGEVIEDNVLHRDHLTKDGRSAFPLLHTVLLPKNLTKIGEKAFAGSAITKLVAYGKLEIIEKNAFENNVKLAELDLPKSVSYIGENAFKGCIALTKVEIPSSIEVLYDNSFDSRYVKSIHLKSKNPPILKETLDGTRKSLTSDSRPTIYVPKGSKAKYESDKVWYNYRIVEE